MKRKKKPLLCVTKKCPKCGWFYISYLGYCPRCKSMIKELYEKHTGKSITWDDELDFHNCKKCEGIGRIDVKQIDPEFKKYYQKALEERIDDLTIKLRNKHREEREVARELRKYCKELDKVVNK